MLFGVKYSFAFTCALLNSNQSIHENIRNEGKKNTQHWDNGMHDIQVFQ